MSHTPNLDALFRDSDGPVSWDDLLDAVDRDLRDREDDNDD